MDCVMVLESSIVIHTFQMANMAHEWMNLYHVITHIIMVNEDHFTSTTFVNLTAVNCTVIIFAVLTRPSLVCFHNRRHSKGSWRDWCPSLLRSSLTIGKWHICLLVSGQNVPKTQSFWPIEKPWKRFQSWDMIVYFLTVPNDQIAAWIRIGLLRWPIWSFRYRCWVLKTTFISFHLLKNLRSEGTCRCHVAVQRFIRAANQSYQKFQQASIQSANKIVLKILMNTAVSNMYLKLWTKFSKF